MKKIISIFLCLILIISCNKSVHAESNSNEFYETTKDNTLVLTSSDPNLPSSGNYYFGLTSDGHVWYVQISKAIPWIMNKVIGVTIKPEVLIDFISDYLEFGLVNTPYKYVYNGSTKIGIAFEDLTGKTLLGSNNTTDVPITIPGTESNNIYNYYNDWYDQNNYDVADYVNIETRPKIFFTNKLNNTLTTKAAVENVLNSNDFTIVKMGYNSTTITYDLAPTTYGNGYTESLDNTLIVASNVSNFESFCNIYNVTNNNNNCLFTSQMLNSNWLPVKFYINNNLTQVQKCSRIYASTDGTFTFDTALNEMRIGGFNFLLASDIEYITVFKNTTILNQFVNQTYAPVSFNSEEYYNYSESNDNSVTTTSSEIDNSTNTNETIYNSTSESFAEYYSENNYHIDNSVTIQSTTEIINNYYGNDNGGDDNGGGGGTGGDDDDNGILDRLLDAIIDFFKNIGKIIGALLAGLFELLNSILDAIANINNSFSGIKNFLSSIFSWFPSEVVTLMVLGLGLALLASFITWFKK